MTSQISAEMPSVILTFTPNIPYAVGDHATFDLTFADDASPVPEPTSLILLSTGLLGGATAVFRRRKSSRG